MIDFPNRRAVLRGTASFALASSLVSGYATATIARTQKPTGLSAGPLHRIDAALRAAAITEEVPGVVALAATDKGSEYEGIFGRRRLDGGPAMTRDTVFRVASMIKPITSVAALQLVEQDKLSLDAPVPDIDR